MTYEPVPPAHSRSYSVEEGQELGPYSHDDAVAAGNLLPQDHPAASHTANEPAKTYDVEVLAIKSETSSFGTKKRKRVFERADFSIALQKRWLIEILAGLLALVALAAIAITLGTHNGRPLPNWPFSISVNALVSIFAVILKAAMMIPVAEAVSQLKWVWYREARPLSDLAKFDLASRGPWGALQLVRVQRGYHLASLGAAITILALAIDPFIQQVIKYHPCPQSMGGLQASILRTNNYTKSGIHSGAGESTLDLPMQAAIYEGVYDSFSAVEPTCSTGNCTFPDYRTVGMCSGCKDISSLINVTCELPTPEEDYKSCNWTLPSGLNLTVPTEGIAMRVETETDVDVLTLSEVISFTGVRGYNDVSPVNFTSSETNEGVMALGCALFPCVRTYSSNVTLSKNTDKLLSTFEMGPSWESPFAPYVGVPMPCLLDGIYHDASDFATKNATHNNTVYGLLPNNASAHLPDACIFAYENVLGLRDYLPGFLSGFVADAPEVQYSDPDWMGQLYASGNASLASVNATWAALADSMTAQVRRNGDPVNSVPAAGLVYRTDTCMTVQWPWLAFPAALVALTWAFLVATVVVSSRYTSRQVWKASPLALLFHGLDEVLRERHRTVDEVDEMEVTAKEMRVQIRHEEGGLRFVPVDGV